MAKKIKDDGTNREKGDFVFYFSPYQKIQCPLHLAPISKRIELQQRAWSQSLAFSEVRILKKRKLKSDKYCGSYDYKQVSVYLCPEGPYATFH